jgi:hypothetical protein
MSAFRGIKGLLRTMRPSVPLAAPFTTASGSGFGKRVVPCITAATVRQAQKNVVHRRAVDSTRQRAPIRGTVT